MVNKVGARVYQQHRKIIFNRGAPISRAHGACV